MPTTQKYHNFLLTVAFLNPFDTIHSPCVFDESVRNSTMSLGVSLKEQSSHSYIMIHTYTSTLNRLKKMIIKCNQNYEKIKPNHH